MVLIWLSSRQMGTSIARHIFPDFSAYIRLKKMFSAYTAPSLVFSSCLDLEEYRLHWYGVASGSGCFTISRLNPARYYYCADGSKAPMQMRCQPKGGNALHCRWWNGGHTRIDRNTGSCVKQHYEDASLRQVQDQVM
jgi:hypothetical protein